jgi:hypothetical protein
MVFDWLIIFLIWFILIVLLISIIFYNRLRVRDFYFSDNSAKATPGDVINFPQNGDYYKMQIGTDDLVFRPLYVDRKRSISGSLVLLTYSTATTEEYYRIRVMNGSKQLSEAVYRIQPKLCYNDINFSVDKGDDRQLTLQIQKYDRKTQKAVAGAPTGIRLVKGWSYYY